MKTVFVFVPNIPFKEIGFLEGYSNITYNSLTFYVTNCITSKETENCIGFCSERTPTQDVDDIEINNSGWVHININDGTLTVNNISREYKITTVYYDYNSFNSTEIIESTHYDDYFKTLIKFVQSSHNSSKIKQENVLKKFVWRVVFTAFIFFNIVNQYCDKLQSILKQTALLSHFARDVKVFNWMLINVLNEKKLSVKISNLLLSKIVDILFGLFALYYLIQYQDYILIFIQDSMKFVISQLTQLLMILMGSPAGLKLNYAFNRTLGTFAFYNISLWKTFVQTITPLLKCALSLILIPGMLGLSYQIALFTDILTFTTFHVYCIYVYAARLYGLQVRALFSLWRLFIGRKYNPLRNRVDSCQYNHHQLFIGTLGFTILLFLLPTTLLYYTVFSTFRIITIILDIFSGKLQLILRFFPLQLIILWICNSEKIKGAVFLERHFQHNYIEAKLHSLPLITTIKKFSPGFLIFASTYNLKKFVYKIVIGQLV